MPDDTDSGFLRRNDIKFLLGLYRLTCLSSLVAIAVFAFLIYQRLPPTQYEWMHSSGSQKRALMDRRWVVGEVEVSNSIDVKGPVEVEGTVQAEVTNTVDVDGEVHIAR